MNVSKKLMFAPPSIAEILVDVVMLFSALIIFAFILYVVVPANTITEGFRNLYHQVTLFFVTIISGIIYAMRHRKVFIRGEFHYLIVVLILATISTCLNVSSINTELDLGAKLSMYWSELVVFLIPIFIGAWTGGFIGSILFTKTNPPGNKQE